MFHTLMEILVILETISETKLLVSGLKAILLVTLAVEAFVIKISEVTGRFVVSM